MRFRLFTGFTVLLTLLGVGLSPATATTITLEVTGQSAESGLGRHGDVIVAIGHFHPAVLLAVIVLGHVGISAQMVVADIAAGGEVHVIVDQDVGEAGRLDLALDGIGVGLQIHPEIRLARDRNNQRPRIRLDFIVQAHGVAGLYLRQRGVRRGIVGKGCTAGSKCKQARRNDQLFHGRQSPLRARSRNGCICAFPNAN